MSTRFHAGVYCSWTTINCSWHFTSGHWHTIWHFESTTSSSVNWQKLISAHFSFLVGWVMMVNPDVWHLVRPCIVILTIIGMTSCTMSALWLNDICLVVVAGKEMRVVMLSSNAAARSADESGTALMPETSFLCR